MSASSRDLLATGAGGVGYLLKDRISKLDELADALTRIAGGGTVLDPEVVSALLAHRPRETVASSADNSTLCT